MIDNSEVWAKLSAPLASRAISWRQDGKVTARDGKYFARFVAYVEANTVRQRLDATVPGNWDLTLELLPPTPYTADEDITINFKARLQILGVIRENAGSGKDYKSAATDAFKRAAVQFNIGHELYDFEQNWVEVDSDSKYPKPVEDPQKAYERRHSSGAKAVTAGASPVSSKADSGETQRTGGVPALQTESVSCPKCQGRMWDNRATKRNPKQPDYKCQNRSCDGVIWPPRDGVKASPRTESSQHVDDDDVRGSLERIDADDFDTDAILPF